MTTPFFHRYMNECVVTLLYKKFYWQDHWGNMRGKNKTNAAVSSKLQYYFYVLGFDYFYSVPFCETFFHFHVMGLNVNFSYIGVLSCCLQGVLTNFEIFRMREKQVPVDVVEMKGKLYLFLLICIALEFILFF